MSFFGKNIKKIRSVKGLSQQSFADLFDLKRGTLGAYEEGRSEPKIETIIKIANYFSILIDDLLKNELTVNQLLKFRDNVVTNVSDIKEEKFRDIPCVSKNNVKDYVTNGYKDFLFKNNLFLKLPISTDKDLLAYTLSNLEMSDNEEGFLPNDIVIAENVSLKDIDSLENGKLALIVFEDQILFRKFYEVKDEYILKANHKGVPDQKIDLNTVKEIWKVKYAFFNHVPKFSEAIDDRIFVMENKLNLIYDKIENL